MFQCLRLASELQLRETYHLSFLNMKKRCITSYIITNWSNEPFESCFCKNFIQTDGAYQSISKILLVEFWGKCLSSEGFVSSASRWVFGADHTYKVESKGNFTLRYVTHLFNLFFFESLSLGNIYIHLPIQLRDTNLVWSFSHPHAL